MDLAETIRKRVLAAGPAGEIAVDIFKELIPPDLSTEEIERLIACLNARDVWIVDE